MPKKSKKQPAQAKPETPEPTAMCILTAWAQKLVDGVDGSVSQLELLTLKQQLLGLATAPVEVAPVLADPTMPIIVRDDAALKELATRLDEQDVVSVDLETTSLDPRQVVIVGVGVAIDAATFYIPISHRIEADGTLRPGQLPLVEVLHALRLEDRPLVAHNAKFEFRVLRYHGGISCRFLWDTMIGARLLRSDLPADLKSVAVRELDVPDWGLPVKEMKRIQLLSIERVAAYCAKDCWYTRLLTLRQREVMR